MDVKRAKQIKRDELALGGLVLDLWRRLGANAEQREQTILSKFLFRRARSRGDQNTSHKLPALERVAQLSRCMPAEFQQRGPEVHYKPVRLDRVVPINEDCGLISLVNLGKRTAQSVLLNQL